MASGTPAPRTASFGPFVADLRSGELRRDGVRIRLQEQPFRILALLLEHPGEVITREQLRERLWPADTFVDFDHGLNTAVKKLRQALDDSAEEPRYVETLARRGYRFIAPLAEPAPDAAIVPGAAQVAPAPAARVETAAVETGPPAPVRRGAGWIVAALALAVILAAVVVIPRLHGSRLSGPAARPSIAVLPFENVGGRSQDDYLADGLTDALMTELARVPGLLVMSRNSAFQYRGRSVDVKRVGSELGVGYVLEGTLQRSGDELRVSARLIDAGSGYQLWADKYSGNAREVFTVQDDISARVREALRINLGTAGAGTRPPTANAEAYDAYLRGRFHHQKLDQWWVEAIPPFEQAVALDPQFALAHAALGNAYVHRLFYEDPDSRWEERAYAEIEKALALDPRLAEAYLARGNLTWTWPNRFPHERAIRDYRRALELNPSLADAHVALAKLYQHIGLLEDALVELQAAVRVEPNHSEAAARFVSTHFWQHRYALALSELERDPGLARYAYLEGAALCYLGRESEGRKVIEAILARDPSDLRARSFYAVILARAGDRRGAEEQIAGVAGAAHNERGYSNYHHAQYNVGSALAVMGRKQEAVRWLAQAADEGFPCYPFYAGDSNLGGLRGDPGFEAFMARLKERWDGYRAAFSSAPSR